MVPLLKHWTALPAISYFLTSSMHVREASRRINTPSTFRPPPRVILTDQKCDLWLRDLSNPKVSLRKLARTIPNGIWGGRMLDEVFRHRIPIVRALWFIRCVGTNEFRTVKRKVGQSDSLSTVEDTWMRGWTEEVLRHIEVTIDAFDPDDSKEWQSKIAYFSRLLANLFYEELLHRETLLDWLLTGLASSPNEWLPAVLVLVSVFWIPLTSPTLVQRLVRAYIARYELLAGVNSVRDGLNAQFVRLFRTRPEAFIMPEHWDSISRYLTQVVAPSAVQTIANRNRHFTVDAPPDVPPAWATEIGIARSLDTFGLPYRVSDLCHEFRTRMTSSALATAVFRWTLRRGDSKALALCVAICRQLRASGANLQDVFVSGMLEPKTEISERAVVDLVTECYRAKVFTFEVYFRRLMGSGALYRDDSSKSWHHMILNNLPFALMPRYLQAQSRMLLRRHRPPNDREVVRPLVDALAERLDDESLPAVEFADLTKNQQILFSQGVVEAVSARAATLTPSQLRVAFDAVSPLCVLCVYRISRIVWRATKSSASARTCLIEFRRYLFEFVCLGVIDGLIDAVLEGLKEPHIAQLDVPELLMFLRSLRDVANHAYAQQRLDNHIRLLDEPQSTLSPEESMPLSLEAQVIQAMERKDLALLANLREHEPGLVQMMVPKWLAGLRSDRPLLCQCVIYDCVTLDELDVALEADSATMFALVLASPLRLNLQAQEIEKLNQCRQRFFVTAPIERVLRIQEQFTPELVPQMKRALSMYPELSLARLDPKELTQLAINYPKLVSVYSAGLGFDVIDGPVTERFTKLVQACNPFTFHFCRSALALMFAGLDPKQIAAAVLEVLHSGVNLVPCISSLFNEFSTEVKAELMARAEQDFLTFPLRSSTLPSIAQLVESVALFARPVGAATLPDVSGCIAGVVDLATGPEAELTPVLLAVSLLTKFTMIHAQDPELDYTVAQCKLVAGLLELNHLPLICSSVEASQFVSDALHVLQNNTATPHSLSTGSHESAPLDGLMMYSRSSDIYTPLNVWPFDLIEDANPTIGMNDLALDLARFETYVEIKDPS